MQNSVSELPKLTRSQQRHRRKNWCAENRSSATELGQDGTAKRARAAPAAHKLLNVELQAAELHELIHGDCQGYKSVQVGGKLTNNNNP